MRSAQGVFVLPTRRVTQVLFQQVQPLAQIAQTTFDIGPRHAAPVGTEKALTNLLSIAHRNARQEPGRGRGRTILRPRGQAWSQARTRPPATGLVTSIVPPRRILEPLPEQIPQLAAVFTTAVAQALQQFPRTPPAIAPALKQLARLDAPIAQPIDQVSNTSRRTAVGSGVASGPRAGGTLAPGGGSATVDPRRLASRGGIALHGATRVVSKRRGTTRRSRLTHRGKCQQGRRQQAGCQ